jgi:hypothetical protein
MARYRKAALNGKKPTLNCRPEAISRMSALRDVATK